MSGSLRTVLRTHSRKQTSLNWIYNVFENGSHDVRVNQGHVL